MREKKYLGFYIGLVGLCLIFLVIEEITHYEFMYHMAAIPLEILMAMFIVQRFLNKREFKDKRRQLMFIKSHMFRTEMRALFLSNFAAVRSPVITIHKIREASPRELKKIRAEDEHIEYKSLEAMEPVIMEYVKAENVWHTFKERAITYNFEDVFNDMIHILHFVNDVKLFKEHNPGKLFIHEAEKREALMDKTHRILSDGIQKFLDYVIEIKEKQPMLFEELLSDYEISSQIKGKSSGLDES